MCNRIFLTVKKATYRAEPVQKISADARCIPANGETTFDPITGKDMFMFKDSDKPGVIVFCEDIETMEFTDVVPDGALIIEFVETAAAE